MTAARVQRVALALVTLLAGGCATVTVDGTQSLQVLAFDANDRPVAGMQCRLANDRGEWRARTPAADVPVQRSGEDLQIDCRRGSDIAMGTVSPRRDGLEQALLPLGSLGVAFDHLSGRLYSYPTVIRLRLGQHLRFEFSNEARATGLIATVGETTLVDVGAGAPPRQPLPAAAPPPPVPAAASAPATRSAARAKPTPSAKRAPQPAASVQR